MSVPVFRRPRPGPQGGQFIAGTWLGALPAPGDELRVLSAARDIGIGLVALEGPVPGSIAEAAAEVGVAVRGDLRVDEASAPRLGWIGGDERDFPAWLRRRRRRLRFVSSFGAPSVAASNPLADDTDPAPFGPDADPSGCLDAHAPIGAFPTRRDWALHTRNYQAMVVRFAIEAMRARRLDPLEGFLHAALLDEPGPVASPGLLGADLAPKEAYRAFELANRPRLAIAERLPGHLHGDETLALDVCVVNDLDEPVRGAELSARLAWADDDHTWGWRVDVEPLAKRDLGALQIVVPRREGELTLQLDLHLPDGTVTSRYASEIVTGPHEH